MSTEAGTPRYARLQPLARRQRSDVWIQRVQTFLHGDLQANNAVGLPGDGDKFRADVA